MNSDIRQHIRDCLDKAVVVNQYFDHSCLFSYISSVICEVVAILSLPLDITYDWSGLSSEKTSKFCHLINILFFLCVALSFLCVWASDRLQQKLKDHIVMPCCVLFKSIREEVCDEYLLDMDSSRTCALAMLRQSTISIPGSIDAEEFFQPNIVSLFLLSLALIVCSIEEKMSVTRFIHQDGSLGPAISWAILAFLSFFLFGLKAYEQILKNMIVNNLKDTEFALRL